jgi:cell division protein FtsZ
MPIKLRAPEVTELKPRITVLGVGGAGGNAVNNMIHAKLEGVSFVVANTDAQALAQSKSEHRIQLGARLTEGLGAGAKPEVGRAAAEESLEEILEHLGDSHMVFITAGMGGGTGTGAAPVIARAVRELGILTVGVVTKPFHFEGDKRMKLAEYGVDELQNYVDTLIIIPNQNLFRVANERTTFAQAFAMADEVLHSGVRGVTDLIVMPGLINRDFNDIKTVMSEMGKAMMGTGEMEGEGRALKAAEAAISNPLLDDVSMKGARAVLINVTGGPDLMLFEVDEAVNRIRAEVDPEANILFGSAIAGNMEGRVRVSVVATGIDAEAFVAEAPANVERLPVRHRMQEPVRTQIPPTRTPQPAHRQIEQLAQEINARADATLREAAMREALAQVSQTGEPMMLGGADAPAIEEEPLPPQPARESRIPAPAADPRRRFGLFGRAKPEERIEPAIESTRAAAAALRATAQVMERGTAQSMTTPATPTQANAAAQPVEAQIKSPEDLFAGVNEEDRFEIPAFLRRQTN